jgi:Tol biopolymer transport system component
MVMLLALSAAPASGGQRAVSLSGDEILVTGWRPLKGRPVGPYAPSSIYSLDRATGRRQLLTPKGKSDDDARWSLQRDRIAFIRILAASDVIQDWRTAVMVMDRAGNSSQLTSGEFYDYEQAWAPDGTRVAFTRMTPGATFPTHLYAVSTDGSDEQQLTTGDGNSDSAPAWSPDGSKIAFARNGNICLLDVVTGDVTDLSLDHVNEEFDPAWSPDGEEVAYAKYNYDENQSDIYATRIDDLATRALTSSPVPEEGPLWSADGSEVLFIRRIRRPWFIELFAKPAGGGAGIRITRAEGDDYYPALSADGSELAYVRETKDYRDVFVLQLETGRRHRLTRTALAEANLDW